MFRTFTGKVSQTMAAMAGRGRNFTRSRTVRGGHDHHDTHHKPTGPYELPHHATYPKEAHPFGIDFSKEYNSQGWELLTAATYIVMFSMVFFDSLGEYDHLRVFGRFEALARAKLVEEGGEVVFGKFLTSPEFEDEEEIDLVPKVRDA